MGRGVFGRRHTPTPLMRKLLVRSYSPSTGTLRGGASPGLEVGSKAELYAGIALEQVLRMLIDEFGVQPRRDDWRDVLTETQEAFETYRTWG